MYYLLYNCIDQTYVMEKLGKDGEYGVTSIEEEATRFTYRQARNLTTHRLGKKKNWLKKYNIISESTKEMQEDVPKYSNDGIFKGDNTIELHEDIIQIVEEEVRKILDLSAWNIDEINHYQSLMNQTLSYYDCAISDIYHVRMGKKPPANVMVQIDKMLNSLQEKRANIKQTQRYLKAMTNATVQKWSLPKLYDELSQARNDNDYKGRTDYYDWARELLDKY